MRKTRLVPPFPERLLVRAAALLIAVPMGLAACAQAPVKATTAPPAVDTAPASGGASRGDPAPGAAASNPGAASSGSAPPAEVTAAGPPGQGVQGVQAGTAAPAAASAIADGPPRRPDFAGWVADFRLKAREAGIDESVLRGALDGVRYLPAVVESDRSQPEFTRPVWDYLDRAVSAQRVAQGRDKLTLVRGVASPVLERYGVPAPVLVAIWGVESNFGSQYGDISTIDALATLGYDGRREAWARQQLLAALRILQSGDIDRGRMIGSWAGAMGQTQFLPSAFLAYAVDADGDGRRDIWGSLPDVMASTANFLARSGWQSGQPWGLEVRLPAGFDVSRADPRIREPSENWARQGVQGIDGAALPSIPDSEIVLPAGVRGPAFLVGPNFRTVLRYNNSTSYALAVLLLAQRIDGGRPVLAAWPRDLKVLSRTQVITLQTSLNDRGFDSGAPDGLLGPATRDAVRRYQRSVGVPADGFPTVDLLQAM